MVEQEQSQVVFFLSENIFDQRKDGLEIRSLHIGVADEADHFVAVLGAGFDFDFIDFSERTGSVQRQREQMRRTVRQDIVPVDPAALDIVDVIIYDEPVHRAHHLPVAQIGKQIRLHNRQFHDSVSPPSTMMFCPCTQYESGESRKTIRFAIYSGRPTS